MHIKIENDQNETEAVLCIERGHSFARVLYSEPEHLRTLTNIAKSLGASTIMVEVEPEEVEAAKDLGFEKVEFFVPMIRRLNGTKSKRG